MKIIDKNKIENESKIQNLERLYINEKKSILEISKIYGCSWSAVKRRLKKCGIFIRPYGAFLVDDDGETLRSKYNKGKISAGEYQNMIAKNRGYENAVDYQDDLVKKKGYIDINEYQNDIVKKKGYKDLKEYRKKMYHEKGEHLPMSENKKCPAYLGVHICENKEFLSKIINIVESMPNNNPGYDVICGKGKKIDVKCACINIKNQWTFVIDKNKIADYFLMISFDNRENLNVQHIWLVKGDSVIEKTIYYGSKEFVFNEKRAVDISKGNKSLKRWIKHEITDTYKLEEIQKVCDMFKNNNII